MIARAILERLARELIGYATHKLGQSIGVAIFVFEFGPTGNLAYISNADRDGMIKAVKEWLARVESGLDTDPPGPRAMS